MAGLDYDRGGERHLVKITLKGRDNETFSGAFILRNLTGLLTGHGGVHDAKGAANDTTVDPLVGSPGHPEDPSGASYYVIAVVLVYGMSIVMLIASHIKRKHRKQIEDKQIHKYLQEFQVVKERSSRDSYKSLKTSIMAKLNMHHRTSTYRTLSHAILPMMAVGLPTIRDESSPELDSVRTLRRASFQVSAFRPVHPACSGKGRRASELDITAFRNIKALPKNFPPTSGGRKEHIKLVRHSSLRGAYHNRSDHLLPSSIEEEMPAAVEGDSPGIGVTLGTGGTVDVFRKTRHLSDQSVDTNINRNPFDNLYYKPISISKDCRVYEIPKTTGDTLKPGGVHIRLPPSPVSKSERRCSSDRAPLDTSDTNGIAPGPSDDYTSDKDVREQKVDTPNCGTSPSHRTSSLANRTNTAETRTAECAGSKHEPGDVSAGQVDAPAVMSDTTRSQASIHPSITYVNEQSQSVCQTISPPGRTPVSPSQTIIGETIEDNVARDHLNNPLQLAQTGQERSVSPVCVPLAQVTSPAHHNSHQGIRASPVRDPHHLNVVINNPMRPGRAHSFSSTTSVPSEFVHPFVCSRDGRTASWCSKEVACDAFGHNDRNTTVTSFTPSGRPQSDSVKRCTDSYESLSSPSGNSSDSDDVWMMMSENERPQQNISQNCDDLNFCPSFPELSLRSAGTSPLLTPKDLRRLDSNDSAKGPSPKSTSSRSGSPATSQCEWDTDKLFHQLHQVTSV